MDNDYRTTRRRIPSEDVGERSKKVASSLRTGTNTRTRPASSPYARQSTPERTASAGQERRSSSLRQSYNSSYSGPSSKLGSITLSGEKKPEAPAKPLVSETSKDASMLSSDRSAASRIHSVDPDSFEDTPSSERISRRQAPAKSAPGKTASETAAVPATSRRVTPVKSVNSEKKVTSVKPENSAIKVSETKMLPARRPAAPERKTSTSRNSRPNAKKTSGSWFSRLNSFKKFIIIYSAAFLLLIIILAIVLNSYLKSYENEQPSHIAEKVVEEFSSTDRLKAFLDANRDIVIGRDSVLDFEESYYSLVEGKKISYVPDYSNTVGDITAYNITADGNKVANIELSPSGNTWEVTTIDTSEAFSDVKGYSILVPDGAKVTANGIELPDTAITGRGIPEFLQYSAQFASNIPEFTTYTVKLAKGGTPEIAGTDSSGNPLVFSVTSNSFVAGGKADQAFIDSVSKVVETGVDEYAYYFEHLAFNLEPYILEESRLHEYIFGSENFDPIDPSLYMYEYIISSDYQERSISNYTKYSDECFTVDVKYFLLIEFTQDGIYGHQDGLDKDEVTMDGTWVWVKDGNSWSITDIIEHTA